MGSMEFSVDSYTAKALLVTYGELGSPESLPAIKYSIV